MESGDCPAQHSPPAAGLTEAQKCQLMVPAMAPPHPQGRCPAHSHSLSPSFTILNVYDEGRVPLYHFDWYRLNDVEELYEMGMDEYLGGDGVAVVEWPTQCPEAIPESYLEVKITPISETEREITLTPCGDFRTMTLEANDE